MILTKVAQNVIYVMTLIVRKFKNVSWFSFLLTRQKVNMAVVVTYGNIPWYTMVYHGIPWYTMAFRYITWHYMVKHDITW